MSQDGTAFAQSIQQVVLWPDLTADSPSSSWFPNCVCPALRPVSSLRFVNVYLIIMEG